MPFAAMWSGVAPVFLLENKQTNKNRRVKGSVPSGKKDDKLKNPLLFTDHIDKSVRFKPGF